MKSINTVSCSVTGYRKILENASCEDSFKVTHLKDMTIMSIADGHGDSKCLFSNIGSKIAVKAAVETLKTYAKKINESDASVYWNSHRLEIAQFLVKRFANEVINDYVVRRKSQITAIEAEELKMYISEQYTPNRLTCSPNEIRQLYERKKRLANRIQEILYFYGTTVRATVLTGTYIFSMALGDGDTIVVLDDGVEWLLPQGAAFECETASLCDDWSIVVEEFVFSFIDITGTGPKDTQDISQNNIKPKMVALCTDGLRNSFIAERFFKAMMQQVSCELCGKGAFRMSSVLKPLFEKLSRESVFQDDITAVFAHMK